MVATGAREGVGAKLAGFVGNVLPGRAGAVFERAREREVTILAAGLGFYGLVSIVPMTVLAVWLASLPFGDVEIFQMAGRIRTIAPESLGAGDLLTQIAGAGGRLGLIALVASLWPASAYGAGLVRAFSRIDRPDEPVQGRPMRGRALVLLLLMPLLSAGTLIASFLASATLGNGGLMLVLGIAASLGAGFATAAAGSAVIYRAFPPEPLRGRALLTGTLVSAAGISALALGFTLYLTLGANFRQHFATSSVSAIVLVAVWLFLANAVLLVGYITARGAGETGSRAHRAA